MNKALIAILILITFFSCTTSPKAGNSSVDEKILAVIDLIKKDPVSEKSREYYGDLFALVEMTKYTITITEKYVPWANSKQELKWKSYLYGAYIAGVMESQITKKVPDDAYAGALMAIFVYNNIQRIQKEFVIEEIEKWIILSNEGQLKNYFK
jgi:hypothetical protein